MIKKIVNLISTSAKITEKKTKIDVEMTGERRICSKRLNLFLKKKIFHPNPINKNSK